MAKQQSVDDNDDILQNIRTFDAYKTGSADERKFYKGKISNNRYFIAQNTDGLYTFSPARFSGYKNNSIHTYQSQSTIQKPKIIEQLGELVEGKRHDEFDKAFHEYCKESRIDESNDKHQNEYWIIDDPDEAQEGGARTPNDEELVEIAENKINDQFGGSLPIGTAEHRSKVDKAAVEMVSRHLKKRGYAVKSRERDKCGYDLLAKRKTTPTELHVEVKGTSTSIDRFFISRNEYKYMENNYNWRLAIVTDALGKPKLRMLGKDETKAAYSFEPMIWFAKPRETEADE